MKNNHYRKAVATAFCMMVLTLSACGKAQSEKDVQSMSSEETEASAVTEEVSQGEDTAEVILEPTPDPTPEPTPEGVSIAEIKKKYSNILCGTQNHGGSEDNIFLGWNDVEGYGGVWFCSQIGDYYTAYDFKPDDGSWLYVSLRTDWGLTDIKKFLIEEDTLERLERFEMEDYDGEQRIYLILSSEPEEVVGSPFGDLTVYYVTYGEYYTGWEDGEHDYGIHETYEADGKTYEVNQIEYAVIQNLGNKALLTATHGSVMPEYEGILSDMIPKLFD